jgi:hypothetical protein
VMSEIITVLGMFTWVMIVKKQYKNADKEVLKRMRIS